tara:strand:+ start:1110 stop:1304 length:195 start_codon:yes stop_codon:yes gene_type:complete
MDTKEVKKIVEDIRIKKDLIILKLEYLLENNLLNKEEMDERKKGIEDLKSEVDYMELLLQDILD